MKPGYIALLAVAGLLLLVAFNGCSNYNQLGRKDEGITAQWKQVEVAYQARMDKTKNLFEIVQSAADFERGTLKEVMEARSKATSIQINADNITRRNWQNFKRHRMLLGHLLDV